MTQAPKKDVNMTVFLAKHKKNGHLFSYDFWRPSGAALEGFQIKCKNMNVSFVKHKGNDHVYLCLWRPSWAAPEGFQKNT